MSPLHNKKRQRSGASLTKKLAVWFLFFVCWSVFIGLGFFGAYYYIEQVKADIIAQVNERNDLQLENLKQEYEQQIAVLKEEIMQNFTQIEAEVTSLNELLIFTRDSANSDFDNSNQLYSQLQQLEEQLNQLKQNLEVLE